MVGQAIFQRAVKGLLAPHAVVLVTHHVHYASHADVRLILGRDGRPLPGGGGGGGGADGASSDTEAATTVTADTAAAVTTDVGAGAGAGGAAAGAGPTEELSPSCAHAQPAGAPPGAEAPGAGVAVGAPAAVIAAEARAEGTVSNRVYAQYIAAAGSVRRTRPVPYGEQGGDHSLDFGSVSTRAAGLIAS